MNADLTTEVGRSGLTARRVRRGEPVGSAKAAFIVEVHDPYSEHPHLTDERFECATVAELAKRIEDATGWPTFDSVAAASEVLIEGRFEHELDGGVEVTAHRVGGLVGGRG